MKRCKSKRNFQKEGMDFQKLWQSYAQKWDKLLVQKSDPDPPEHTSEIILTMPSFNLPGNSKPILHLSARHMPEKVVKQGQRRVILC